MTSTSIEEEFKRYVQQFVESGKYSTFELIPRLLLMDNSGEIKMSGSEFLVLRDLFSSSFETDLTSGDFMDKITFPSRSLNKIQFIYYPPLRKIDSKTLVSYSNTQNVEFIGYYDSKSQRIIVRKFTQGKNPLVIGEIKSESPVIEDFVSCMFLEDGNILVYETEDIWIHQTGINPKSPRFCAPELVCSGEESASDSDYREEVGLLDFLYYRHANKVSFNLIYNGEIIVDYQVRDELEFYRIHRAGEELLFGINGDSLTPYFSRDEYASKWFDNIQFQMVPNSQKGSVYLLTSKMETEALILCLYDLSNEKSDCVLYIGEGKFIKRDIYAFGVSLEKNSKLLGKYKLPESPKITVFWLIGSRILISMSSMYYVWDFLTEETIHRSTITSKFLQIFYLTTKLCLLETLNMKSDKLTMKTDKESRSGILMDRETGEIINTYPFATQVISPDENQRLFLTCLLDTELYEENMTKQLLKIVTDYI
jgi:hypothetical protein